MLSYTPQPCNIDMMVNANGQLSAGPATILSADGFYRCSMCAYKTDKKANWYKHRYTHMCKYMPDNFKRGSTGDILTPGSHRSERNLIELAVYLAFLG